MLLVGLTGGIASGKSTVARLLRERGAVVVDADELARAALDPGTSSADAVLARFGDSVRDPDGGIDRRRLADIVFADEEARADLEAIVHPVVRDGLREVCARLADTDAVVVFDAPLLVETGMARAFPVLVVVAAHPETQVTRLLADRGMSESDARARIAAQASLERKVAAATEVVDNDGSLDDLARAVDALWGRLRALARADAPSP